MHSEIGKSGKEEGGREQFPPVFQNGKSGAKISPNMFLKRQQVKKSLAFFKRLKL